MQTFIEVGNRKKRASILASDQKHQEGRTGREGAAGTF